MIWTLEKCTELLRDQNPHAREWAVERLGEIYWDRSYDLLQSAAGDKNEDVRSAAKYAIEEIEDKRKLLHEPLTVDIQTVNLKQIKKRLSSKTNRDREAIIEYIARRKTEIIPLLIDGMETNNDTLYDATIKILSRAGRHVLPLLCKLLEEKRDNKTLAALYALQFQPYSESVEMLKDNFEYLWKSHYEVTADTLACIGSTEFIPLLEKESYPGEYKTRESLYTICVINHIAHPSLTDIRIDVEKQSRKLKIFTELIQGKRKIEDTIEHCIGMRLECKTCGKTYSYDVDDVIIDVVDRQVYVGNQIRCKNCKALDNYNLTGQAHLAIRSYQDIHEDARANNPSFNTGVIKYSSGMGGKKKMSISQMLSHYEKELSKEPKNAEYRVGAGNILLRMKRYNEAEKHFLAAVEANKNAVEAYYALGKINKIKDNPEKGREFLEKAANILDTGDYYRTLDKTDFRNMLLAAMDSEQVTNAAIPGAENRAQKVGRNAPCPCGSGRKYKKCCLNKDMNHEKETDLSEKIFLKEVTREDLSLQEKLSKYIVEAIQTDEGQNALKVFAEARGEKVEKLPDSEKIVFADWFTHDYKLKDGSTVIKNFYKHHQNLLTPKEIEILAQQKDAAISFYETTAINEGTSVTLRNLFSGEEYEVFDITSSRNLVRWDIFCGRIGQAGDRHYFMGHGHIYSYMTKEEIKRFVFSSYEAYRQTTGISDWKEFFHDNFLSLFYYNAARKIRMITEEGDDVKLCETVFSVCNFEETAAQLSGAEDFMETDRTYQQNELTEMDFVWLAQLEKKQKDTLNKNLDERLMILQSHCVQNPSDSASTKKSYTASITLNKKEMITSATSERRMIKLRKRLASLLGENIKLKSSSTKEMEEITSPEATLKKIKNAEDRKTELLNKQTYRPYMGSYMKEWINTPLPALGGKSPLQAVKIDSERGKVETMLREIENTEARRKKDGQPHCDIAEIRKLLGL